MKSKDGAKPQDTKQLRPIAVYVTSTWILTIVLAALHVFVSIRLIPLSCERSLVAFNVVCAGILLTYGGLLCTSLALGTPMDALEGILRRTLNSTPKLSVDSLAVFAITLSAIALTFAPLYGFYVSVSSTRCKMGKSGYYTATLVLNSLNVSLVAIMTWVILRFDDLSLIFRPKLVFNDIKMRILKSRKAPSNEN